MNTTGKTGGYILSSQKKSFGKDKKGDNEKSTPRQIADEVLKGMKKDLEKNLKKK